jgi:integrase
MQGSIQKRVGKRGTVWTAVVDLPRDPATGKRKQKRITAPTKKEVEQQVARTLHELQTGTYVEPSKLTVGQWVTEWLVSHPCRESSWVRYELDLRRWILPALGSIPLAQLRATHVQRFYRERLEAGATPQAVKGYAMVLGRALQEAVRQRLVLQNVVRLVPVPKAARRELTVWTREDMQEFLRRSADDRNALLYEMALKTGMRRGELLALRWQDVHIREGWLSVQRTVTIGKKGAIRVGDVKTKAGRRRIRLSPQLVAKLRSHRQQRPRRIDAGQAGQDAGLVFQSSVGTLVNPTRLYQQFKRLVNQLGLKPIRFHDLRHTFATLTLADGANVKAVSAQLGHSSIATTLDLYAHVTEDMEQALADRMEALAGR